MSVWYPISCQHNYLREKFIVNNITQLYLFSKKILSRIREGEFKLFIDINTILKAFVLRLEFGGVLIRLSEPLLAKELTPLGSCNNAILWNSIALNIRRKVDCLDASFFVYWWFSTAITFSVWKFLQRTLDSPTQFHRYLCHIWREFMKVCDCNCILNQRIILLCLIFLKAELNNC